jgi:hypothetical protein
MIILGSIGKFYRMLKRYNKDDNKRKRRLTSVNIGKDGLIGFKDEILERGGGNIIKLA